MTLVPKYRKLITKAINFIFCTFSFRESG